MSKLRSLMVVGLLVAVACGQPPEGSRSADGRLVRPAPSTPEPSPGPPPPAPPAEATALAAFDGCRELLEHVRGEALERVGPYGLDAPVVGWRSATVAPTADAAAPQARTEAAAPRAGTDFSQTNVQVEGVDEPDIVKTDGSRIFVVAQGNLHALRVEGDRARYVSALALEGYGQQLLLSGDRLLAVTASGREVQPDTVASDPWTWRPETHVDVVDVGDLERMRVVATTTLEGSYVSARMIDGAARLVLNTSPARLPFVAPSHDPDGGPSPEEAEARNRQLIERSGAADWLPAFEVRAGGSARRGALASCEQTYRPDGFSGFGMTTVVTIDPHSPEPRDGASVLGDAATVYATAHSLYVATSPWSTFARPGPEIAPSPRGLSTQIHRFDITGAARYVASGEVAGTLLNQWALDEHADHLRVATTVQTVPSESFVTVLATDGAALVPVGSVGGLGLDERIYSVRFMGDVGYVVTFREVDPLYVLDLSDPGTPRVTGELKIPGYSAYLHPMDDGFLLGVGQDADDEGMTLGTQVSIFDVRDPTAPQRLHMMRVDGASSEAEWDHHAFLYWRGLVVLPVQEFGHMAHLGALALEVTPAGIEERGRITHPDQAEWNARISRSLVVGPSLYTVSEFGVLASDLVTLERRGWVPLA